MADPHTAPSRMPTTKKYAFEDLTVGRQMEFGAYEVKREDILRFAAEFDPQPFHLDEAAAERSLFKGLSASGWHTCAIVMRMTYDGLLADSTSLGSPGLESLKWTQPVRPGDVLHVRFTVLERRSMKSRPQVGLVRAKWQALNQRDEVVLDMEGWGMYGLRDAPPAAA
jgi:acyl dehydratase